MSRSKFCSLGNRSIVSFDNGSLYDRSKSLGNRSIVCFDNEVFTIDQNSLGNGFIVSFDIGSQCIKRYNRSFVSFDIE
jgi:hypothetical protein